jgi:hypothetical protein
VQYLQDSARTGGSSWDVRTSFERPLCFGFLVVKLNVCIVRIQISLVVVGVNLSFGGTPSSFPKVAVGNIPELEGTVERNIGSRFEFVYLALSPELSATDSLFILLVVIGIGVSLLRPIFVAMVSRILPCFLRQPYWSVPLAIVGGGTQTSQRRRGETLGFCVLSSLT